MRQQIDPVSDAVGDAVDRLTPRLADIKTRLDQLGPKPADSAPPESPAVTAERADQQKLYNDTGELLKRARLLAVQARSDRREYYGAAARLIHALAVRAGDEYR